MSEDCDDVTQVEALRRGIATESKELASAEAEVKMRKGNIRTLKRELKKEERKYIRRSR